MKKILSSTLIMAAVAAFGVILTVSQASSAEGVEGKVSLLESQLSQLIESQNKLTEALSKSAEGGVASGGTLLEEEFKQMVTQSSLMSGGTVPPSYVCYSDYHSWPSSTTYDGSHDWNTDALFQGNNTVNWSDINGDGLLDHVLLSHDSNARRSCINMNNGRGWDLIYKCYATRNVQTNTWTFYGDCADTAS